MSEIEIEREKDLHVCSVCERTYRHWCECVRDVTHLLNKDDLLNNQLILNLSILKSNISVK